jgi:TRAP-type C4-dicarboxylate transport system permease small subunit
MFFHWRDDEHFPIRPIAVLLTTAAALVGIGSMSYVALVGPIPSNNRMVESLDLLFSIFGIVLGLKTLRPSRWFSTLALVACCCLCVLFFLAALSF